MAMRRQLLLLAALLIGVAATAQRVCAETYTYQGQVQIQPAPGDPCAVTVSAQSYPITIYGRDDEPQRRYDAYVQGEDLVRAHVTGNSLEQLAVTFPGESAPRHLMQLRPLADGSLAGTFETKTMVTALGGCGFLRATLHFIRSAVHTPDAFAQAQRLFELDAHAVEAYVQGLQGRIREALPVLQQGLAEQERIAGAEHMPVLPYYFFLAQLQDAKGSYLDEIPLFQKAVRTCEKKYGAESLCAGLMLASLGEAQVKNAEYVSAESSLRRAQAITDRLGEHDAHFSGLLLNAMGAVLMYTGRYGDAEPLLRQALAVNTSATGADSVGVGLSLLNQGVLYRLTGQYTRADAALRQALVINQKALGDNNPLVILNTIDLAQVLRLLKRNSEAEPLARHALAAAERVLGPERPDHPALALALVSLAEILREEAHYAEAESLARRALQNGEKYLGADHPQIGLVCLLLAKLKRATGKDPEALPLLQRAYRISRFSQNQLLVWRAPAELMAFYADGSSKQPAMAIFYGKEAVNTLERIRAGLLASGDATQQAFVGAEEIKTVYRQLAQLLISEQRLPEAQQVLAMLKEQEYFDFTEHAAPARNTQPTAVALDATEKQLDDTRTREVQLGKEYAELQEKFRTNQQLDPQEHARLNTLRSEMDRAQANFETRAASVAQGAADPEAQKRRRQEITDFSRAFQGTLKAMGHDAVLAQYFILDDHVEILLTTSSVVLARQSAIQRDDLNQKIARFRKALSGPNQDPMPQAKELYDILLRPIADDLAQAGAKMLMLSLDDTLRYVPFAALHDGKGYLIESLPVAMATEAVRDKLARAPADKWSVWGLGVTHGGADYPPLPYAGAELNGIAGSKGILTGKVLLDQQFNENSLRDGLDQGYPVIHIASHFQFTPGSMDDSFLLLGDGTHLTLAQIKTRLNFSSVELLTLSACETALGDAGTAQHGVEVEGLGAIAQQAGARAVLATLWPVADESTALLMRTLYEAHKDAHADKADALQAAQLALLHGSVRVAGGAEERRGLARQADAAAAVSSSATVHAPFAHPFYWAPFILMGNWQ